MQQGATKMVCQNLTAHVLAGASASTAFIWGIALLPASANAAHIQAELTPRNLVTDHSHDGNGRRNHNIFSLRSPTHNHGYQHTSTGTVGGMTSIQNALCRHAPVCNIYQKVIVVAPKKPKAATPKKADTFTPQKVDAPAPEEVTTPAPEKVDPPAPEPAPEPVSEPVSEKATAPTPGTNPFLYLGPLGFMLMAPDPAMSQFIG
jgi:hypothetical protein